MTDAATYRIIHNWRVLRQPDDSDSVAGVASRRLPNNAAARTCRPPRRNASSCSQWRCKPSATIEPWRYTDHDYRGNDGTGDGTTAHRRG